MLTISICNSALTIEVQSQLYRPSHEIIWLSHQKKADTIYCDFPSNVETIAGSLRVLSYSSIFAVFLEMPTPFGISRKASGLLVCVCKSALLHQRGIFWQVCVFSRQLLPGWRKEGLFIWAMLVWTLSILTCSSESCQKKSSAPGSSGQQNPQKQWEKTKQEI